MPLNEGETRFHLIDPVLRRKGYDDPQRIKLETPAPAEPVGAKSCRRIRYAGFGRPAPDTLPLCTMRTSHGIN